MPRLNYRRIDSTSQHYCTLIMYWNLNNIYKSNPSCYQQYSSCFVKFLLNFFRDFFGFVISWVLLKDKNRTFQNIPENLIGRWSNWKYLQSGRNSMSGQVTARRCFLRVIKICNTKYIIYPIRYFLVKIEISNFFFHFYFL